jgi:hypothetical protein
MEKDKKDSIKKIVVEEENEFSRAELNGLVSIIKSGLHLFNDIRDAGIIIKFLQHIEVEDKITIQMEKMVSEKYKAIDGYFNSYTEKFIPEALKLVNKEIKQIHEQKIKITYAKFDPEYQDRLPSHLGPILYLFSNLFN